MPRHSETRFLPFTPAQLFDLVADIERYPEFLPWCVAARVTSRKGNVVHADLIVGYKALREKFTSVVTLTPKRRIDVTYVSGPLANLVNAWQFKQVKDGCELSFDLEFTFKSAFLGSLMQMFFEQGIKRMAAAFEKHAYEIYG